MKDKILIVESDKQLQEKYTDLLKLDYECVHLQNSAEGLEYLENTNACIDLIIMDLMEVNQNGYKLLKGIQEHFLYNSIPILARAELAQAEMITCALKMGVDDIIITPIIWDIAKQRISNLLTISKNRRVHNVMEDLIESEINENIDTLKICPCPKCRKDLLTLTLNNVKPKYISTEKGEAIIKAARLASMNDRIQLLAEITRYANLVSEKPRHN